MMPNRSDRVSDSTSHSQDDDEMMASKNTEKRERKKRRGVSKTLTDLVLVPCGPAILRSSPFPFTIEYANPVHDRVPP